MSTLDLDQQPTKKPKKLEEKKHTEEEGDVLVETHVQHSTDHTSDYSKISSDKRTNDLEDDYDVDKEPEFVPEEGHASCCAIGLAIMCFPFTLCGSCYCVKENEEAVILSFGKYAGTVREPGIQFSNCWGREIITISRALMSTEIPITKCIDKDGNPVMVSGVVFYHFRDTKKAALDILDRQSFVSDQAAAVLKQIVAHYPYDNHNIESGEDESDEEVPCLKRDTDVIVKHLVSELQKCVNISGAKIDTFKFNEISYAPEIAASLLKKQQASAIVASRHTLVDGAVRIASTAVARLDKKGVAVDQADKGRLISNLLTVVCADQHVQPVLSLGST